MKTRYGRTYRLRKPALDVECWNHTDGALHDLPAGTLVNLCHANDATRTTVCVVDGRTFDLVGAIMDFEEGRLSRQASVALLTELKEQGMLDSLQGRYGREARRLGVVKEGA
jgi:hypothetical protein